MAENKRGEAKKVIKFSANNQIDLDEDGLKQMLLHEDVKDREIVLISIVGPYRKGKSFFMNYCLRFMYANYKSIKNPNNQLLNKQDWLGSPDAPLEGFSWRSGSFRDTTGISFWSDVFLYDPPNGDPTAIILSDTQGLFDPETTTDENVKILSLSALFSSTLVLNLNNMIQEDQLEYLQFTTEYSKFIQSQSNVKPFQKFLFLVRDWQNVDEYEFGYDGGQQYLNEVLKIKQNQPDDLRKVREHIRESFSQLLCYLMPYPGKDVATAGSYDGRWSLIDEDFVSHMKSLIENYLSPQVIKAKQVDGYDVKGHEFFSYIRSCIDAFSSTDNFPKPKSLYELVVGRFLTDLVGRSFETYEKALGSPQKRDDVDEMHIGAKTKALAVYSEAKKMGSSEEIDKYRTKLEVKIAGREVEWKNLMKIHFDGIEEEQKKALEAMVKAEMTRLAEEAERKAKEEQVERLTWERLKEKDRKEMELAQQQKAIEEEQKRQKEAEEAIRRERERQLQLEEERRRVEEERKRKEEEERERERIKVQIDELGIKFHVPNPVKKCSVM